MPVQNADIAKILRKTADLLDIEGASPFAAQNDLLKQADLGPRLKTALDRGENFDAEAFETSRDGQQRRYVVTGRIIKKDEDFPYRILLHFVEKRRKAAAYAAHRTLKSSKIQPFTY